MKIIRNNRINKHDLLVDETIFSVANGYLGTRGTFTEGYGTDFEYNQTYCNAFYNYYDYHYEENLSGFPQFGQKYVNILDGTKINILINGTQLNLSTAKVMFLNREYDLTKGQTIRKIHYRTKDNKNFYLKETKFISSKYKFVISIKLELTSPDYEGPIEFRSYLEQSIAKHTSNDPRLKISKISNIDVLDINKEDASIHYKTTKSDLFMISKIMHNYNFTYEVKDLDIIGKKIIYLEKGKTINLIKHIIHTTSLYEKDYLNTLTKLQKLFSTPSWDELSKAEEINCTLFWKDSGVELPDNSYIETLLNYNIFQLNNQGGEDILHNIGAKGLSGEGYEGHYFWDTEIYMIPFFILTNPSKAKKLLLYRYHTLEFARQEAKNLGYNSGVKIPWRTINGKEISPYYPAGSAQFHINSDIAYAIIKYFEATNDLDFLINYGFEIILETGRFLKEAVNFNHGHYHLNGVTGPDEYTAIVDDNYYTNQMLQYHFKKIYEFYQSYNIELEDLIKKLSINIEEINKFKEISEKIFLPFDKKLGIFAQDKNFLNKKNLDLKNISNDKYPLLLNFHPLYLYRHQVLKQADSLLAMMLLDYPSVDIINNSFNYYLPITTHDSSLSKCVYSILAFKLNKKEIAYKFFKDVLETDYKNIQNNTEQGLHVANLGGSYLVFTYGLVGLRIHKEYIVIDPQTIKDIKKYKFSFYFQGFKITVKVNDFLSILTTGKVTFKIYGNLVEVDGTYQCDLK